MSEDRFEPGQWATWAVIFDERAGTVTLFIDGVLSSEVSA